MNFLVLVLMNLTPAHAWEMGNAPFCVMDNFGNLECYYYDLGSCQQATKQKIGPASCVKR
jgi:hypothetical protein